MDDLPRRFADALESAAERIRALTADRLESWIRAALLLFVLVVLGSLGLAFCLIAVHRVLSVWLGTAGSVTTLGGLSLVAGLLIWNRGADRSRGGK